MCSLNQIIKSSVPASLLLAILSSSVSTSWTPPKKVWRSMWCSNDSTDHLGFMSIYVDLCGFMQFIWCCFSRNYAIYGDFFRICLPTNLLAELLMNVNGSTPKKMEISRFIWVPVTTDQFCLVHLILKKKHYAVSDWKTPPSNMRFFFVNHARGIPWMEKTHSAKFPVPSGWPWLPVSSSTRFAGKSPMFRWIFPQKKVPSSGIFQPRLILQKTGKCPKKSPWFTVNHRYSPVLSMIYHYIFTIIDRYWPLLTIINYY